MTAEITEAPPVPYLKGAFALYNTPDGGIHVSYRPDGADADEHIQIPGIMMTLVREMNDTGKLPNPLQLMKMLRGS